MVRIDTIELDAAITEKHSAKVEITKHPIEEGANPTDHARLLPLAIMVEGFLTNTPLGAVERAFRGVTNDPRTSTGARGAAGPAQQAMAELEKMRVDKKVVSVVSDFRSYDGMLITSIEVPRDAKTGEAIRFTITLEEIRIVRSEIARVDVLNRPKKKPTKKVDQTKQPGTEASEADRRSVLAKGDDWTGRSFSDFVKGLGQ